MIPRVDYPETMTTILPPGEVGEARVEHFEIERTSAVLFNIASGALDAVCPGRYVRLYVDGVLFMSDTDMERRTNWDFLRRARGDVLITGLGIGLVIQAIASKVDVTSVTVIEKSADVVSLVRPTLPVLHSGAPVEVVVGDAFTWKPPKRTKYDAVYHDIWPDMCTDNLKGISRLKHRYSRWLRPGGWQGAWVEDRLRASKRREDRHAWREAPVRETL